MLSSHAHVFGRMGIGMGPSPGRRRARLGGAIGIAAGALIVLSASSLADAQPLADQRSHLVAVQFYRDGQRSMAAEKFEAAVELFTKAVQHDRLLTIAHYGLGHAYMNLQRYSSAVKAFESCIEATRDLHAIAQTRQFEAERARDDEIRELRESIRMLQQQGRGSQVVRAEQHLSDLQNHRGSLGTVFRPPAEVLLSLGSAHFRSGNVATAEDEWKAALQVNPRFGEAHNNLAVVYMMSDRLPDAEAEIKQAEHSGFRVNPQFKRDLADRARIQK
jgi:tetratricopeptide (TPR) repeat protein